MKKITSLLLILLVLSSCNSEGELTKDAAENPVIVTENVLLSSGDFMSTSGINVTGSARIYSKNNQKFVQLTDFSISNGPDLKVYLSKTDSPSEFVNLGALTSAKTYSIPAQVNLADYPYVLIHCQQYNHLFAVAAVSQN